MVGTVYCTLQALSSVFYQFFYPLFVLKIKQKPELPYTNVSYSVSDQTDTSSSVMVGCGGAPWPPLFDRRSSAHV